MSEERRATNTSHDPRASKKKITEVEALRLENLGLRYELLRVTQLAPLEAEKAKLLAAIEQKYDAPGWLIDLPNRRLLPPPVTPNSELHNPEHGA